MGSGLADRATGVATYEIHGVELIVRANDPGILDRVDETYRWFATERLGADDGRPRVEVALVRDSQGGSTIVDAEGRTSRWRDDDQPLVALFDAIVGGLITGLAETGVLTIHAGVVALGGRGVLIAGRSGRGKTTLVLGLLRRGLDLLSDELALLAPDDRTVQAYPRGLHVRGDTVEMFPELGFLADIAPHELGGGSQWSVGPGALDRAFGTKVSPTARLSAIILLDGDPIRDAAPQLDRVPGAIATMELLRGTPGAAWDFDGVLARVPRILADVPCTRLRSGRLEDTVDAILTCLSDEGPDR